MSKWNDVYKLWIDTRISEDAMNFLRNACSTSKHKKNLLHTLAGNISKSEEIVDEDNWFYETTLKPLTEKLFLSTDNNYYKYYVEKKEPLPKFEMIRFWVNYMKQHEFNPLHNHSGLYSFVIFIKIPTHWKDQHALPICANSNSPSASDFSFVWSEKNNRTTSIATFTLNPADEGRILFFPAWLQHMVYPFYECEEERITISGNIAVYDPKNIKEVIEKPEEDYGSKEYMLKTMEYSVKMLKKELKGIEKGDENIIFYKKTDENRGSN